MRVIVPAWGKVRSMVGVSPARWRRPADSADFSNRLGLHAQQVFDWLLLAQAQSHDGGVPAFYDILRDRWAPSYPETTGYTIPTFLTYSERYGHAEGRRVALQMAEYLLKVQRRGGGIPSWTASPSVYVFDTGQVLFGWLAAWEATEDQRYRTALVKAADWLISCQEPAGFWQENQFGGHRKVWDVRVAWPLALVGKAMAVARYGEAACRFLEWAVTQQNPTGWFENCALEPGEPPVTHTIAYAVEGFLESGLLLNDSRYIEAARRTADALLDRQRKDGGLSAYWDPSWKTLSRSSCLTGNAQMALCWLRLYQYTGETRYLDSARRALAFVAATQISDNRWPPVQGAIAGSWPVWGRYLRWRYPNWAAKFFLDACMLEQAISDAGNE